MSFTNDWSTSRITDHLKFKNAPGEMRSIQTDLGDRLASILYGFTTGETISGIKLGRFIKLGTGTPTAPAGTGAASAFDVYTRVNGTGTTAELYCQGGTGGEIQITSAGTLKTTTLATILGTVYPVGCIYTTTVVTNPGTVLGVGTWDALGAGRCLIGDGGGYTAGNTGGAATHTLITAEMPGHAHTVQISTNLTPTDVIGAGHTAGLAGNVSTTTVGGGGAHNNLQPYLVVYFWQRSG